MKKSKWVGFTEALAWKEVGLMVLFCLPMLWKDAQAGSFSTGTTLQGRIVAVTDGDTATVLDSDNQQHVIRLFGIDAPETSCHAQKPSAYDEACVEAGQAFGKTSKRSLSSLIFGKDVTVELQANQSSYGREVGTIWVGNINANLEQVKRGMAMMYKQFAKRGMTHDEYEEMEVAERHARESAIGLWNDPEQLPPWEYRHSH